MACFSKGTRATLRVAVLGIVVAIGACADDPNLPRNGDPAHLLPSGPSREVYPIGGVTGTACRQSYIDDGNGGCIYAPTGGDDWGGTGGGTSGGTTSGTGTTGSGGSGGSTPSPLTESIDDEPSQQDTVPNCALRQFGDWESAFCRSSPPTGARLDSLNAALTRMQARAGECANLATEGRRQLAAGRLRIFPPVLADAGAYAKGSVGIMIADYWVDKYGGNVSQDNRNLDHVLAHEIDHMLGRRHTATSPYETPNSRACSGLSGTSPWGT